MWMEEAMLMLFQWLFSSSDALLFIKYFSASFKIMFCDIKTFEKHVYNNDNN